VIKRPFLLLAVFYVLGEVLAAFSLEKQGNIRVLTCGLGASVILAIFACVGRYFMKKEMIFSKQQAVAFAVSFCSCLLGCLLYAERAAEYKQDLSAYEKGECYVTGEITYLEHRAYANYYYASDVVVYADAEPIATYSKGILVGDDSESQYLGQQIVAQVTYQPFKEAANPGNYDEQTYYQSCGIGFRAEIISCEVSDKQNFSMERYLYRIRCFFADKFYELCDEKTASYYCGILLGESYRIVSGDKAVFRNGGIGHILAISGLHISLIGMALYHIMRKLTNIKAATIFSFGFMGLYVILTGSSISAIRAVIMFILHLLADACGRRYDFLSAIGCSAFLILCEEPFYLLNSGFQMSFGAIFGVGFLGPLWERYMKLTTGWLNSIFFSIIVQVTILPVQLYTFFQIAPYSIFLNVLVIPSMGLVLWIGIIGVVLGGFLPTVGEILLNVGGKMLDVYVWLCDKSLKLPGGTWIVGQPKAGNIIIYYMLLFAIAIYMKIKIVREQQQEQQEKSLLYKNFISIRLTAFFPKLQCKKKRRMQYANEKKRGFYRSFWDKCKRFTFVGIFVSLMILALTHRDTADLSVTFLDVGQGDCIVLTDASGMTWLVDGGSSDVSGVGVYRIIPYLKSQGISCLDYMILTHTDQDHMSGLMEIIKVSELGIKVKNFLVPDIVEEEAYQEICALARAHNIPVMRLSVGVQWENGNFSMRCIAPAAGEVYEDTNEASAVLWCEYQDFSLLLTGDIGKETEEKLLAEQELTPITVLKAAHHGSKYSSSQAFLETISPQLTIISVGKNNNYGHPHEETLLRLAQVHSTILTTMNCGCIEVIYKDGRVQVRRFKSGEDHADN